MAATISSLGIGSGVLTADVIDQLREVDETRTIKPIDDKLTLNSQKQDAYSLLSSLMKNFGANTTALENDTIFENKDVSVSGDAQVSVATGAKIDSFTLETTTLAKRDVTKLGAVADKTTSVASDAGSLKISNAGGDYSYEIAYEAGATLEEIAQAITDAAGNDISASILKTNEGAYNLVISSKTTGADQVLTIEDTDGVGGASGTGFLDAKLFEAYDAATNPTGLQKTQTAVDAEFKYNGIAMTRSSNTIDDLVNGVTMTLKKESDFSDVTISNDYSAVSDELELFVSSYNTLMSNLKDMTTSDQEKGTEGVFNKDSFIKSISRDLIKSITSYGTDGNSLTNYGISLDREGVMSFDKTVLDAKLSEDAESVKLFFSGGIDSNGVEKTGIFETIDDKVKSYTASGKLLSNYEDSLKSEADSLAKNKTNAQKSLDARYETMSAKYAAYDSMISKMESQFSSLKMMIDAEANAD